MTTEDKQLLLRDLCARLPYNPYIFIKEDNIRTLLTSIEADKDGIIEIWYEGTPYSIEDVKLYLRPMESMTDEEIKTYQSLQDTACSYHYEFGDIVDDFLYFDNDVSLDYLNSLHIDYRGLIPMGLAIEAPEGIYKTN